VTRISYSPGQFLPAYRHDAGTANERCEIWIDHNGRTIVARQIVGVLARGVVCRLETGATVSAGDRYGVMKFGSRMDVFVPTSAEIRTKVGDLVRGGETVIAVAVAGDEEEREQIRQDWERWECSVPLEVLIDPHRSLIRTVLRYVESMQPQDATITVLIPEIIPSKRRHEILHNQRGRLLETALKARTSGVVIATLPFHIHD